MGVDEESSLQPSPTLQGVLSAHDGALPLCLLLRVSGFATVQVIDLADLLETFQEVVVCQVG